MGVGVFLAKSAEEISDCAGVSPVCGFGRGGAQGLLGLRQYDVAMTLLHFLTKKVGECAISRSADRADFMIIGVALVFTFIIIAQGKRVGGHICLYLYFNAHRAGGAGNHFFNGRNVVGVHVGGFIFGNLGEHGVGQLFADFFAVRPAGAFVDL